jgi:hypothetical protein
MKKYLRGSHFLAGDEKAYLVILNIISEIEREILTLCRIQVFLYCIKRPIEAVASTLIIQKVIAPISAS